MQASVTLIRCTVVDGHLARDVEIGAVPETETAAILAALPFDLARPNRVVSSGSTEARLLSGRPPPNR